MDALIETLNAQIDERSKLGTQLDLEIVYVDEENAKCEEEANEYDLRHSASKEEESEILERTAELERLNQEEDEKVEGF